MSEVIKKSPSIVDLTVDSPSPLPPRPRPLPHHPPPLALEGWYCDHCTFINSLDSLGSDCETCGLPSSSNQHTEASASAAPTQTKTIQDAASLVQSAPATIKTTVISARDSQEFIQQKRESPSIVTRFAIQAIQHDLVNTRTNEGDKIPTYALSCACDHISQASEKWLWSCGYRNIQMMISGLMTDPAYKAALFGGSGIIPDIPSLQMWIERAWRLGFDLEGAASLGGKLVGAGKKWIGSTEAAILLRSFGLRAKLVSFHAFDDEQVAHLCSNEEAAQVSSICQGAEARLYARTGKRPLGSCFSCGKRGHFSNRCPRSRIDSAPPSLTSDGNNRSLAVHQEEQVYYYSRNQGLVDWVTQHFYAETEAAMSSAKDHDVEIKDKRPFPVYFQHSGHSRLLVGWEVDPVTGLKRYRDKGEVDDDEENDEQVEKKVDGSADIRKFFPSLSRSSSTTCKSEDVINEKKEVSEGTTTLALAAKQQVSENSSLSSSLVDGKSRLSLLIFDPAIEKSEFDESLSTSWRRVVKRGLHTLRESQFEAVYVEVGSPVDREGSYGWEKLKVLDQLHYVSGLNRVVK